MAKKLPKGAASSASGKLQIWTPAGPVPRKQQPAEERLLQQSAMKWSYRLQNRERWVRQDRSIKLLDQEAARALQLWGFDAEGIAALANTDVAEVRIPYDSEEQGWAGRVFPWEYILSAATRALRGTRSLTVVRQLQCAESSPQPQPIQNPTLLILASSPGPLDNEYDFSGEVELVQSACRGDRADGGWLNNPAAEELRSRILAAPPDVVHVSAVDTRLAYERLSSLGYDPSRLWSPPSGARSATHPSMADWQNDGVLLRGSSSNSLQVLGAAEFAALLTCAAEKKPAVVGLNVWNSASRIAPLLVAQGAQSALGFHTTFDDGLAELFFATYYDALRRSGWADRLGAFRAAWSALAEYPTTLTRGTGVVLWSATSLLAGAPAAPSAAPPAATVVSAPSRLTLASVRDKLEVRVRPIPRVIYSLLHNDRPLFQEFKIGKHVLGTLPNVRVEVRLFAGAENVPYVKQLDLVRPLTDLTPDIHVPLISELSRRLDESVKTGLYVKVSCEGEALYEDTHRVTLSPIDLWKDTDEDRQWLPSFVLPRDPAVLKIVQSAQFLLACLSDDLTASFDGYQSTDGDQPDPHAAVDRQVQALWTALTQKLSLSYVNPPPTYEPEGQRLRTPTQILEAGHGTCIDLALLLAACLEYVGIYPVVFLITGHAFPGYWRSEDAYYQFTIPDEADESPAREKLGDGSVPAAAPWIIAGDHAAVMDHVRKGHLIPFESTLLTSKGGFRHACEAGLENLRSRLDFQAMIDIGVARMSDNPVTPLPLGDLR